MTVIDRVAPSADRTPRPLSILVPALLALAAGLVRLPFLMLPLSSDEGGYLLVSSQWTAGASTYGDYFVDRPPLLIGIFGFANALGGSVPLRLLGLVAVMAAVVLSWRIGGPVGAAVAAIFLSTPLFDAMQVDGELIAVPFVLGGLALLVHPPRSTSPGARYGCVATAGVLATCAVLVKQDVVDVFVVAAVLFAIVALRRQRTTAMRDAAVFGAGALGTMLVAVALAAARGTGPASLWDAIVVFRAQAAAVIDASANAATPDRFYTLLAALLLSGGPLVVLACLGSFRAPRSDPDLRWAAVALLVWELVGAVLGGSYWLHYLLAVVPGLVLLAAAAGPTRAVRWSLAIATASTVLAIGGFALASPGPGAVQAVSAYLRVHSAPDDTVVVAFGHPDIVRDSGLTSPYSQLWSLPVRVRDPRLHDLASVLTGADAPRWVVVDGASLATWGVDPAAAQSVLDRRYREVTRDGDWHVFEALRADRQDERIPA